MDNQRRKIKKKYILEELFYNIYFLKYFDIIDNIFKK